MNDQKSETNNTTINNEFIKDIEVDPDCKGLILYVLSLGENRPTNADLIKFLFPVMGRHATNSLLKRACDTSYMFRMLEKDTNGRQRYVYYAHDDKTYTTSVSREKSGKIAKKIKAHTEKNTWDNI